MPLDHPVSINALSDDQIATVQSTIPLLESAGTAITTHFYNRLFSHNPELQHIFNMSNQHSGKQQFALFSAIASYAKYIDNLPALQAAVERIANKHTSLAIQPEHYPIVGHHLIETLRELAPEAFTPKVEEAWTAAYELLASVFINKEEKIYKESEDKSGGWRGAKKFRLIEKRIESELVKSLVFEPVGGGKVASYKAGQYIGIKLCLPNQEFEEIRQYSLSDKHNDDSYQISVKREITNVPGIVSNFLHDGLRLGDEVELYPPAGDFFYTEKSNPVTLISAGVGATPMKSILETLANKNNSQNIYYLHACESIAQHSFKKRIAELATSNKNIISHTWYRSDSSTQANTHQGFMDLSSLENSLPLAEGDFYLCGPVAFMRFAKQQLVTLGVCLSRIHYEVFGPHEAF